MDGRFVSMVLAGALLSLTLDAAGAELPPDPIKSSVFCSENLMYCAKSTMMPAHTDVLTKSGDTVAWAREEFVRRGFVSNDGQVMVSCLPRWKFVPENAGLDDVVVRIFHASGKVDQITLRSLYTSMSQLPRTESGLVWGYCMGIEDGKMILERADESRWESPPL